MSEIHTQNYCLKYSRLSDLLQGVQGRTPAFLAILARFCGFAPTVHIEPLSIRVGLLVVWGVLVTARRRDEILSAWVIADKANQPTSGERRKQGQDCAATLCYRIEELVRAWHLRVQPGYYGVPEQAFLQVASFAAQPGNSPKGGH